MSLVKVVPFLVLLMCSLFCALPSFAQINKSVFSNEYNFSEGMFESNPGQLELLWRARVYGEGAKLDSQSSEVGGFDVNAESKYTLIENLEARVFLRGKFQSGRSQSFFGDLEPNSGIFIREAAVKYMPVSFADAKVGVINQDWMDMPMLTFRQSFPGAMVDFHHAWTEEFATGLAAQWLIPTSQTLSPRTVEREATPSFTTQTAYAKWDNKLVSVKGSASLYEYKNLPSLVAFESQRRGNNTLFINGPNNSEFRFPFKGWFTQAEVTGYVTPWFSPIAYLNVIKNEEAPETFNDGQVIGLGADFHTTNYMYEVRYENVFIESDAVPGAYNAWAYGNTNKKGQGIDFALRFKKKNFRIRAQYFDVKLINADPLQQNQQYFYLGVETGYDQI